MLTSEFESDEELEANLLREPIEIALVNGVSDAETLRDCAKLNSVFGVTK